MSYPHKTKRKGVSPLIAAVLLIAFTMAVAALLTAWVTQFTTAQKEESEKYQEKIDCSGSNFVLNEDFVFYEEVNEDDWNSRRDGYSSYVFGDGTSAYDETYVMSVRLENIGFNPVQLERVEVWFSNKTIPEYLDLEDGFYSDYYSGEGYENGIIIEEDADAIIFVNPYITTSGIKTETDVGHVEKLKFFSSCDGVWYVLDMPNGGWNTDA